MTVFDTVLGYIGGGPGRVDVAGGTALVVSKAEAARNKILDNVEAFGAKLGPVWGSDIFKRLSLGADAPAAAAVEKRQQEVFGVSTESLKIGGLVAVGVLVLVLIARKK